MNHRFVMSRRVEFVDTDMAGIVHFTAFFRYMETAEHEMFRSLGLSLVDTRRIPHLGWPRVSCGFDFIRPLRYGDMVEVHIGISAITRKSIAYEADVVREGEVMARGHSTSVCCEVGPHIEMRPIPIPAEIGEKLQRYLISTDHESTGASKIRVGGRSS